MSKVHIGKRLAANLDEIRILAENAMPECEDEWGPNYAILKGIYATEALEYHGDYMTFDEDQWTYDLVEMVKSYFPKTVTVKYYPGAQELEVYR